MEILLGLVVTERSAAIKHLDFNLGIFIDSAAESLSFTGNDGPFAVLDQTTSGQVVFALGLWDRLNLSISQFYYLSLNMTLMVRKGNLYNLKTA